MEPKVRNRLGFSCLYPIFIMEGEKRTSLTTQTNKRERKHEREHLYYWERKRNSGEVNTELLVSYKCDRPCEKIKLNN